MASAAVEAQSQGIGNDDDDPGRNNGLSHLACFMAF
jgi:hypothetical protein